MAAVKDSTVELILHKVCKDNKITLEQGRELFKFPFNLIKGNLSKLDVSDPDTLNVNFLFNGFMTMRLNKFKIKKLK